MKRAPVIIAALAIAVVAAALHWRRSSHDFPVDDAKAAGKTTADFPQTATRAFDAMDGGLQLTDDEVKGRNTWLFWTAGDQVFWDGVARHGLGTTDLLKLLDSRRRNTRFGDLGLINEPDMEAATAPDEFGLWLDVHHGPDTGDLDPAVYGKSSGVIGLRLFSNPNFDNKARSRWDADRYYRDHAYYESSELVRPYVVGMACAFCHVSLNPERPPDDPENPAWANLSSTIGNQYLNSAAVFASEAGEDNFVYQILRSWPRGTVDTSFIATDHLNNPGNINPIFSVSARLSIAETEAVSGGAMNLPGETNPMQVPHVLKDGADSVGIVGALSRVYVSVGEYSQEWLRDHNAFIGGTGQRPFEIGRAQQRSVYWQATAERIPNLIRFLLKVRAPRLAEAPGGIRFMTRNQRILRRGKILFAENCARCHSSKQPPAPMQADSPEYQAWMRGEVLKTDFLEGNFLSTDKRIPVTVVQTNAARALATNATRGHIWDNFSSDTYKTLPSVGAIEVLNPFTNSSERFTPPGGGPGYYRVPSLLGIWATAPFLHNNALGQYAGDPSVRGRMLAFDDAVRKLLWPEKRLGASSIFRTSADSYLVIPVSALPAVGLQAEGEFFRIGPIPAGTPVDLIANTDLDLSETAKTAERLKLAYKVQSTLRKISVDRLTSTEATALMRTLVPDLLRLSKCPDFVQDRGHYFGTQLSDADKRSLIEFMKTF